MRALILSDTHTYHDTLNVPTKGYSIAIHTGDFSTGSEQSTDKFLLWFSELPCKHKLLVAGNHDWFPYKKPDTFRTKCYLLGITYLEDSYITINGIKFHGTPWVPTFYDWAFMNSDNSLQQKWDKIPPDTDVLLTHGPAHGYLDKVPREHAGSRTLAAHINTLQNLSYHIFGHIHEGCNGEIRTNNLRRINASCLDGNYRNANHGRIINIKKGTL